jgi:DNA-binding transcriptional MerR regulator
MTKPLNLQGLTMREVIAKTGASKRKIYGWIQAGLLPAPAKSGRGVRYDDAFVERVTTILRLRREHLSIDRIRRHLATPPAKPVEPAPPPPAAAPVAPVAGLPAEQWERLVLLPGLELSYRTDGGPGLRRLAAEIWRQFGASPAG